MSGVVLDASAVLALLLGEPGSNAVARRLGHAHVSAVNYSEVLGRAARLSGAPDEARRRVDRVGFVVDDFDRAQAAVAASILPATRALGLSLADRACLALGRSRGWPVLTADRAWAGLDVGVAVELIR